MMKFLILYKGPATPPDASHAGWPEWFAKVGNRLTDMGSPMRHGLTITSDAVTESTLPLNSYGIIDADSDEMLQDLLRDHPYTALGDGYSIEAFEIPKK